MFDFKYNHIICVCGSKYFAFYPFRYRISVMAEGIVVSAKISGNPIILIKSSIQRMRSFDIHTKVTLPPQ